MDLSSQREAVNAAYFQDESGVIQDRLHQMQLDGEVRSRISAHAEHLVRTLRADPSPNLMESFLAEYGLSTDEGIALMCLAEAYLRVPDAPTLDALIRDKIGGADWAKHSGETESLLVNASTWALMLTGRIFRDGKPAEAHVVSNLRRMVQRIGEPVVRTAVAQAMKVMGQQFVLGRTIDEAIDRGTGMVEQGYSYSYDMLGEAARTMNDARRYLLSYSKAITTIGEHAPHDFVHDNPGISVKLSALHPRYETVQHTRMMDELVPRLEAVVELARNANIGLNIDAEEADRLGLSLEIVEAVMRNGDLKGWDGFGIVVQAYSKQCMATLEWANALADQLGRRIAVRLVKGAYWDMEIKNAQILGLDTYPVFTRKTSTDVSYLAGARYLLDNAERLYPQFATHNAHTTSAILEMAGQFDGFEFQRLHGMGDALHELLRREHGTRCRIYAPVGVHEDLLAYLVRRLLENGANSSFVNQLLDEDVPAAILVRDPVDVTRAHGASPHPHIPLPPDLFGAQRRNARGWNINNPTMAAELETAMAPYRSCTWTARPIIAAPAGEGTPRPALNPADEADRVGDVYEADATLAGKALDTAADAFPAWRDRPVAERATILDRIADLYERDAPELMAILTREAGKTRLDGVLEVREAVDFCRYYAARARETFGDGSRTGLGPFVCISPWNFPLAIFTGQIAAALAAGNTVIAKPAEQTPLVAAKAVSLMLEAGLPEGVISLLPGDGAVVGGALTADPRVAGVCFTGSTETAIVIDRSLARAGNANAPLIAETGGLNAMIVDSTALPEHAVRDIVASAFQSAGQRCSALRALFVQKDIADHLIEMLEGATRELQVGDPWDPATDVGPAIDDEARAMIEDHCRDFEERGRLMFRHPDADKAADGRFVYPTAIRLERFCEMEREVFGPVLHVLEFEADEIDSIVDQINASGYGLTFGLHSRVDDRVEAICARAQVGNLYVNRNQIGAVVGVQPFGGEGLSGTGPKAGGPHYLNRFSRQTSPAFIVSRVELNGHGAPSEQHMAAPDDFAGHASNAQPEWDARPDRESLLLKAAYALPTALQQTALGALAASADFFAPADALPGPTGESNHLTLHGRGIALCLGGDETGASLVAQTFIALAAGNAAALVETGSTTIAHHLTAAFSDAGIADGTVCRLDTDDPVSTAASLRGLGLVAFDGDDEMALRLRRTLADRDGARVPIIALSEGVERFATERVISIDTTASGGNATLLTLEEG